MYRFYLQHQDEEDLEPADVEEVERVRAVAVPEAVEKAIYRIAELPQRVIDRFKDILYFKAVRTANLSILKLRDADIASYVAPFLATYAPHIVALDLSNNYVGPQGFQTIIAHCRQITILDVSGNQIANLGVETLANNNSLKHVSLGLNGITSEGLKRLVTNECLTSISCAEYRDNQAVVDAVIKDMCQRRKNLDRDRKLAFLMGMHPRLGQGAPILHSFFRHRDFEPLLIKEIFDYLQSEEIEKKFVAFPEPNFCH